MTGTTLFLQALCTIVKLVTPSAATDQSKEGKASSRRSSVLHNPRKWSDYLHLYLKIAGWIKLPQKPSLRLYDKETTQEDLW
jgi:hypothetical protein